MADFIILLKIIALSLFVALSFWVCILTIFIPLKFVVEKYFRW